jgi:hypothetical protein
LCIKTAAGIELTETVEEGEAMLVAQAGNVSQLYATRD